MKILKLRELNSEQLEALKFENIEVLIAISVKEYLELKKYQSDYLKSIKEMSDNW